MEARIPAPLRPGALIGVLSPASPAEEERIEQGLERLRSRGYRLREAPHARARLGYLAGSDEERAKDLMELWADEEVEALFCLRGGYGTLRLLDRLDYSLFREHPKPLVGYSDITALQWAIWAKSKVVSFSGPMVAGLGEADSFTWEKLWAVLEGETWEGVLRDEARPWEVWRSGEAEGRLMPGNLSLIVSLMGTPYLPDLEGAILVLEDVGERPYRVDRALNQLRLAGVFHRLAGLVLGDFGETFAESGPQEPWSLRRIVETVVEGTDFPIVAGLAYGHLRRRFTLPVGAWARLRTEPDPTLEVERA